MSQNQPRTEKIVGHQRKPGRTGGGGTGGVYSGGGGGGAASAAPPAAFMSNELPVNQSSKNSGSQQGGQSKVVNSTNSKFDTAGRAVVNGGACNSVSSQGASDILPLTNGKLDSLKKVPRAVPKAPAAQCTAPAPGGDYTPFLQFGTINPGIVKGMQVPARTCSAPPNLDEQKSDQERHESLRAIPALPTVSAPEPLPPQPMPQQKQQTKQGASQAEIREAHSSAHAKRDMIHASMSCAPTTTPARSSVLPVGGIPTMHHPQFQRPQVPMQFSGPNMPMQPYGIVPTSYQMTMALPSGNIPQVPQPMFVPSIQSHPIQPQAIMHHGQNLGFLPQLGHQFRPQSMELNITPQFPQPQPGKLVSQRRAVKITHPDTHEELKLDKRNVSLADSGTAGQRQFQNAPSQSSPCPSFNHHTSSYPTAYNHSPMFYPSSSSVPLTSTQMSTGPHAARYSYPGGQNGQPISFPDSSHFEATFTGRPGPPAQVSIKPSGLFPSEKTRTASVRISMPVAKKESSKLIKLSADVPVASQQNDKDVGYQNTGFEQKQNCEPLGTDSLLSENDKKCRTPSGSTHGDGDGSEPLFSVSAPVSDSSISSVAEKNNGREEALVVSEFVQDQQKILCEVELKQFQQPADTVEPSVSYGSAYSLCSAENLPVAKKESSKLIKLSGDVPVAPQQKDEDVGNQSTFLEQNQNCEPLVTDSLSSENDKNYGTTSSSTHGDGSGPLFSVIAPVSDASISSMAEKDNGREEALVVSEFVQDQQNILCEMELKQFKKEVVTVEHSVSFDSANSLSSTTNIPSIDRESRISESMEVSDSVRSSLEKEPSQDAVSVISDPVEASDSGGSFVQTCQLQASTSTNTVFVGVSRTSESSVDRCGTLEPGGEHERSSGGERASDEELVTEFSEKKALVLSSTDNSYFASPEEGESNISAIMGTAVSTNPTYTFSDSKCVELVPSDQGTIDYFNGGELFDPALNKCEILCSEGAAAREPCILPLEMTATASISSEIEPEINYVELCDGAQTPVLSRVLLELNGSKKYKKNCWDQSKAEGENCEVAANASIPKLSISENGVPEDLEKKMHAYSRNFLLSLKEQYKDLPYGFEVGPNLTNIMSFSAGTYTDGLPLKNAEHVSLKKVSRAVPPMALAAQLTVSAPGSAPSSELGGEYSSFIQFGTITPGIVKAMQARRDSLRAVPVLPTLFAPKPLLLHPLPQQKPTLVLSGRIIDTSSGPSWGTELKQSLQQVDSVEVSGFLRSSLEKEPSQDATSGISDSVEASDGGGSFVQTCQLQTSTSSNTVFVGVSRTSESSIDRCDTSEPRGEHERSSEGERASDEELMTESSEKNNGVVRNLSIHSTNNLSIANFGRDRPSGPARGGRRMAAISDDSRWNKFSGIRMDHIHEDKGVLRNLSLHSTNNFSGGLLSGPTPSFSSQRGIGRNSSDLDRWKRPNGIQRGMMPSPQGLMQVIHKSVNRYEIGRASDEEEKKQRRLKAILNKLTPQNFEKLLDQVKEVNIDNVVTLTGVISQIFNKALMEPNFCEMYADFCFHLATELPDIAEGNQKITFKSLLLNKCQEEFERGEKEQAEADSAYEEGEIQQTEGEREEKRIRAHRRMLGNIRLIGELYKKKMLTDRIMHECINNLLGHYQKPNEEHIEALCKLMSTIGKMIDHVGSKRHMDAYFDKITVLSTCQKLSSRLKFMLKDTIDLRNNKWRLRRKVEGPKKIEDVHRDAAQERQAQISKLGWRGFR